MSTTLTTEEVGRVLSVFATEFLVDIPAKHGPDREYWIGYGQLEYDLTVLEPTWLEAITKAVNGEE